MEQVLDADIALSAIQVQHRNIAKPGPENLAGDSREICRINARTVKKGGVGGVMIKHANHLPAPVRDEQCKMLRIIRAFQAREVRSFGVAMHRVRAVGPADPAVPADLSDALAPSQLAGTRGLHRFSGEFHQPFFQPIQVILIHWHQIVGL